MVGLSGEVVSLLIQRLLTERLVVNELLVEGLGSFTTKSLSMRRAPPEIFEAFEFMDRIKD